jgi:hypothetical protein
MVLVARYYKIVLNGYSEKSIRRRIMSAVANRAPILYRANAKIKSLVGYRTVLSQKLNGPAVAPSDTPANKCEDEINRLLSGYPRNHNYQVIRKRLLPSFRLYERLRLITGLYSEPLESFLDIGCCRGFFVLDAAQQPTCRISVGIDVHQPFVITAEKARQYLDIRNAAFHFASLQQVADNPENYGGPFKTVLLVGTYHYLFWGSQRCSTAYHNHRQILQWVAHICTDRCIFSGRLEVDKLPYDLKQNVENHQAKTQYTTENFLRVAGEFFDASEAGFLGTYPLFVLLKKHV